MKEAGFWVLIAFLFLLAVCVVYPCLRICFAKERKPMTSKERADLVKHYTEQALHEKLKASCPSVTEVVGEYTIQGDKGTGHCYPVSCFTITPADVEQVPPGETLTALCPHHALGGIYGETVRMYLIIRKKNVTWRNTWAGRFIERRATDEIVYRLSVMSNNTVRFTLPPGISTFSALSFLWGDSESNWVVLKNLVHVLRYGCFCLGMYMQEEDGTWILQRYNRWAEDVTLYWYARIRPSDKRSSDEATTAVSSPIKESDFNT